MRNRRNYYRILHVQPDAPTEVIRSCFRALMLTLEMHPDRGGDHWNAALLNEAFGVLSDPRRREAYDLEVGTLYRRGAPEPEDGPTPEPEPAADANFCAFCGQRHPDHEPRCGRCGSPLTLARPWAADACGRRAARRAAIDRPIVYYADWPQSRGRSARIRDLSPTGLRLELDHPIDAHRIVKLESDLLGATARVAHCRRHGGAAEAVFAVGVEFFTLSLEHTTGVFLSVSG